MATETAAFPATLHCKSCKGTGIKPPIFSDKIIVDERRCFDCNGSGSFNAPDLQQIISQIRGRKGLRTRRPDNCRAYYVWRLARFHGGVDVTLPIMAELRISGDPYKEVLDSWASMVAKTVYGSETAGIERWRTAIYG